MTRWRVLPAVAVLLLAGCGGDDDDDTASPSSTTAPPTTTTTAAPAPATYTVVAGDTLSGIATKLGTTVADLVAANDLADPDRLEIGQVLVVPEGAAG